MADNNLKPQSYEQVRQQELTGTGIASPNQVPWPAQQAAARELEQQAAAAAATQDKALKARQNWSPAKNPYTKKGK